MEIFAVSIKYSTGYQGKQDFDACDLILAHNEAEALAKIKEGESEEEGYYDYEVKKVDLEKLKSGEVIRVYGKYNW